MGALTSKAETINAQLICSECGDGRSIILGRVKRDELGRYGQVRIYCPGCQLETVWFAVSSDRRSGMERRTIPHARLELPIQIRCEHPAQQFTEVTTTLTASSRGASFRTRRQLRKGMQLAVVMPFDETDNTPLESRARVSWLEKRESGWEVGVEILS